MKKNAPVSRRPFNPAEPSPDFLGPIAPEVYAQPALEPFPKFPSVEQLLDHQNKVAPHPLLQLTETAPPTSSPSIFQGLLGGRLEILTQDALDHPERYDDATKAALSELAAGTRKVEDAGRLLDSATMDFAAFRAPPARPAPAAPVRLARKPALLDTEMPDSRTPPDELEPGNPMSAYWWL